MRILFIGLLSSYTDGMAYQDNMLAEECIKEGHEVMYISNCNRFENGKLIEVEKEDVILSNKIRLIRLPLVKFLNKTLTRKLVVSKGLFGVINNYKPDVIFHHGAFGNSILTVKRYVKKNPDVKFYLDNHSDFNNGAKNSIQRMIYKYFLRIPMKISMKYIEKVYYISLETKEFLEVLFKLETKKLEFLPLGGIIDSKDQRNEDRKSVIKKHKLNENDIIFLHSGKLNSKKKTLETLRSFSSVNDQRFKLFIIGKVGDDILEEFNYLISNDKRIKFLGWKDKGELKTYLNSADLYIQMGSQSATMQNAACSECALALYPFSSHYHIFEDNIFYIKNKEDLISLLIEVSEKRGFLESMKQKTFSIALKKLNYNMLVKRFVGVSKI